jgi:hypothetical protein
VIQGFVLVSKPLRIQFSSLPPDRTSRILERISDTAKRLILLESVSVSFLLNISTTAEIVIQGKSGGVALSNRKSLWVGFQRGRLTRYAERDK